MTNDKPTLGKRISRRLWFAFKVTAMVYLAVLVMLVLSENGMVYPARKYPKGDWQPERIGAKEVRFQSTDSTELVGWYLAHADPRGIVLFFHGNGENVADTSGLMQFLHDKFSLSVFSFDYRGYGKSDGKPGERGVCQDGLAAMEWLVAKTGAPPSDIILMGRSLGGGVAVNVARQTDCRALVLMNTFASMPDAAARKYPIFPVRFLMRNRYPSIEWIAQCDQPLLQCHGNADQIAPLSSAQRLFDASPARNKQLVLMDGVGHNDGATAEFWRQFGQFLATLDNESNEVVSPNDAD